MEHEEFLAACLKTHRDLLEVEQSLHNWLSSMTGIDETSGAPRPRRAS